MDYQEDQSLTELLQVHPETKELLGVLPPKPAPTSFLPGYSFQTADSEDINSTRYLVKGVIGYGDIAFMFGDSGTLKSFVATDLAYHVAAGIPWHGHRVNNSGVLIVIAEGQGGYKKRIKAVIKKYQRVDVPIWVVPEPVALDKDSALLHEWLILAEEEMGVPVGLILMDTFSLMLGDCDESSNSDISVALNNLRKAVSGRAVLLVHHTGHGEKSRERGAYQIRGNADVRIQVQRDEGGTGKVVTITNLKNKDNSLFDPIDLGYEVIELGIDSDGDPITSLVITATDIKPNMLAKPREKEANALEVLKDLCKTRTPQLHDWRVACEAKGVINASIKLDAREKDMQRIRTSLENAGLIQKGIGRGVYIPTGKENNLWDT